MRRREGMVLEMALIIVLVGSLLIAAMFDLSTQFTQSMTLYRSGYAEHVALTDYLEKAKGFIVQLNTQREAANADVLHGPGVSLDVVINSLSDLQLTQAANGVGAALSVDRVVLLGNGRKRVVMRVFDANYNPHWVTSADVDWSVRKEFPPSLMLDVSSALGSSWDGVFITPGQPDTDKWRRVKEYLAQMYRDYGAYVVRVQLYDIRDGNEILEREVEEGFFQAINQP